MTDQEQRYWDLAREAGADADTKLLWLAGGAIALSAKYVTDNYDALTRHWSLIVGWGVLALGIMLTLLSLTACMYSSLREYNRQSDDERSNPWTCAVSIFNGLALLAVSTGIAFVLSYFWFQLSKGN